MLTPNAIFLEEHAKNLYPTIDEVWKSINHDRTTAWPRPNKIKTERLRWHKLSKSNLMSSKYCRGEKATHQYLSLFSPPLSNVYFFLPTAVTGTYCTIRDEPCQCDVSATQNHVSQIRHRGQRSEGHVRGRRQREQNAGKSSSTDESCGTGDTVPPSHVSVKLYRS